MSSEGGWNFDWSKFKILEISKDGKLHTSQFDISNS